MKKKMEGSAMNTQVIALLIVRFDVREVFPGVKDRKNLNRISFEY